MAQVIIVSNRLPVSISKENDKLVFSPSLGGVATGLASYVDDPSNMWIGWPGIASDTLSEKEKKSIVEELKQHNCYPVFLSQKQIDAYYNGFSNSILWPLFHELPLKPVPQATHQTWWQAYRSVNEQFKEAILSLAEEKSQIWVHDYQLMLLPELLRTQGSVKNIGFFLHIPFPAHRALKELPETKKLLSGLLGADLIGFHTKSYVQNFLENVRETDIGQVGSDNLVILGDRSVRIAEFPMGIDYEKYAAASRSKLVRKATSRYKKRYGRRRKIIVSVDRLDPTKGLEQRLLAYQAFLRRYPAYLKRVVFVMVAAPSRTDIPAYAQLAKRLGVLAQQINQTYGSPTWQPVDFIHEAQPFEEVAALFSIADVAFIAPLRDGMNLSAKEFVASNRKNGVLILSATAGAAQELHDALLVNPLEQESLISALNQALSMRRKELRNRLKRMQKDLSINTVQHWAKSFVETLQQPLPGTYNITRTLGRRQRQQLLRAWQNARKRLLLLDYDGSLVSFTSDYKKASPPASLLELLNRLSSSPKNDIVIVSGRNGKELESWFKSVPINLVAEHGASTKMTGHKKWQTVKDVDTDWKALLLPSLEKYAKLAPGAKVEIKPHSLVWHYRAADPYYAHKYAVIVKRTLKPLLKTYGLELLQGNKVLEIKNPRISKAQAVKPWLSQDYDFILVVGDDTTDESLFSSLPLFGFSIKIGRGRSAARFRLSSSKKVIGLLQSLLRADS